jgi:hypothetical protein
LQGIVVDITNILSIPKRYLNKIMASLDRDLKNMREYFRSGKTKEASWRESQLKGLLSFLIEKENDIFKALMQDLGKHRIEAFRDEVCLISFTYNFFKNIFIFILILMRQIVIFCDGLK